MSDLPVSNPASSSAPASALRLVLILGLLSAIGPFAIDMYLPALPQIGASLNAPVSAVQASLTAFFLALGVGQPLFGSLADLWGLIHPASLEGYRAWVTQTIPNPGPSVQIHRIDIQ